MMRQLLSEMRMKLEELGDQPNLPFGREAGLTNVSVKRCL
jgi:hypothetical protein